MNEEKYTDLIYRQWQGNLSEAERRTLTEWLAESADNQAVRDEILQSLSALDDYVPDFEVDLEADYAKVKARMEATTDTLPGREAKTAHLPRRRLWLRWAAAAAVLLVVGLFFWQQPQPALEWVTLETKAGEQKQIALSDGSTVWLHHNSRLMYPTSFAPDQRLLKLTGQAFFEVTKKPDQPFVIQTTDASVEVLGTSFNVRSYPDEPTSTVTVKTGTVRFSANENSEILTAGQETVLFRTSGDIIRPKVPDPNTFAWQTGQLQFNDTPLSKVFDTMEKHFGIKITSTNPDLANCHFSMGTQKTTVHKLFDNLKRFYKIKVEQTNEGTFVVSEGKCR